MKWSVQQYLEAGGQQGLFTERSLESVVHWPSWPHGEPVQALLQPVTSIGLATAEVTMLSSGCCIRNNYMSLQQTFQGSWEKSLAPRGSPNSQLHKSKTESIDAFDADWYKTGITCLGNASVSPGHAVWLLVFRAYL